MQTPTSAFEPFGANPVRRESWVNLHRRRSQRLDNAQNYLTEEKTPNSLKAPYSFVHVFNLLLCITRNFKCHICQQLFMDVTVLNCGHAFCKFCLTKWLQSKQHCPVCLKVEVHPICNRCYNLDSLVLSSYHQLLEILDPNNALSNAHTSTNTMTSSLMNSRLEYIQTMQNIRKERRQAMIGANCMTRSWSCPNRSMLQGVSDLGFGLSNSMEGFILLVIGAFFLATAVCQISDLMENLELFAIRRVSYIVMIIYLLGSHRTSILRREHRQLFWNQIFKRKVSEKLDQLYPNEKKRMMILIKKKQIDSTMVQLEVRSLIEKLGVFEQLPQ